LLSSCVDDEAMFVSHQVSEKVTVAQDAMPQSRDRLRPAHAKIRVKTSK